MKIHPIFRELIRTPINHGFSNKLILWINPQLHCARRNVHLPAVYRLLWLQEIIVVIRFI